MIDTEYTVELRAEFTRSGKKLPAAIETKYGAYLVLNPRGQPVDVYTERKWAEKDAESRSKYAREHCAICGGLWSEGGHYSCLGE